MNETKQSELCERCEKSPKLPDHKCPYSYEMCGESEDCSCCEDCTTQCALDI